MEFPVKCIRITDFAAFSGPELETHKNVANSYAIWRPLPGKIPQVHVIFKISSISMEFGGKCALGGKIGRNYGKE